MAELHVVDCLADLRALQAELTEAANQNSSDEAVKKYLDFKEEDVNIFAQDVCTLYKTNKTQMKLQMTF